MRKLQLLLLAIGFGTLGLITAAKAETLAITGAENIAAHVRSLTQAQRDKAVGSAITDTVQTAVGVGSGLFIEANPLGVGALLLKPALLQYCAGLPESKQGQCYTDLNTSWSGVAAHNYCMFGAVLAAPMLAPACLILGLVWGMNERIDGQDVREFWAVCSDAATRYEADHPGEKFTCTLTPRIIE